MTLRWPHMSAQAIWTMELNQIIAFNSYLHTLVGQTHKLYLVSQEPPLGVIREQGEWPLRAKGARSMA